MTSPKRVQDLFLVTGRTPLVTRKIIFSAAFCGLLAVGALAATALEPGAEAQPPAAPAPPPPKPPKAWTVEMTELGKVPGQSELEEFFSDGLHMAYGLTELSGDGKKAIGQRLSFDGKAGPLFDEIRGAALSPDGARCAYRATVGKKFVAVVDGVKSPEYTYIDRMYFSPDSKHLAYGAERGEKEFLVVDGHEQAVPGRVNWPIEFSPDGKRVACELSGELDNWFLFVDGKTFGPYHGSISYIMFSSDSRHVACVVSEAVRKQCAVLDGQAGPVFEEVYPIEFSPDGKHFAYVGRTGEKYVMSVDGKVFDIPGRVVWHGPLGDSGPPRMICLRVEKDKASIVVDGKKGPQYDFTDAFRYYEHRVSADGRHYAFPAAKGDKRLVVYDGKESPLYDKLWDHSLTLSPDGLRHMYTVPGKDQMTLVVDGRPQPVEQFLYIPYFSPDSKHFAYIAHNKRDGREFWRLVLDGAAVLEEAARPSGMYGDFVRFTPDSCHTVIVPGHRVITDDEAGPEFDDIVYPGPKVHADGSVEYLIIKDDVLYRVKHTLGK